MPQKSKAESVASGADAFGPLGGLFMAVPRMQATAASMILKQQKEIFEFLSHRCERDLEFIERLGKVDDASKVPGLWSKFVQGASQDYADEARKCVDVGSRSAAEMVEQIKDSQTDTPKMAA